MVKSTYENVMHDLQELRQERFNCITAISIRWDLRLSEASDIYDLACNNTLLMLENKYSNALARKQNKIAYDYFKAIKFKKERIAIEER